jgi:hypothetical protein
MQRLTGSRCAQAWLARALVALFLIAQGLVAAHACPPGMHGVSQVLTALPAAPVGHHDAACHEGGPAPADANLCVSHCTASDQTDATPQVAVAAMPEIAVLALETAATISSCRASARVDATLPTGGPPPAIRFQILRI